MVMRSKLHYIILLAKISLVVMLIIQPYNFFCNLTSKCRAFYFSDYVPRMEGKVEFEFYPEAKNYVEDLVIIADKESVKTVVNRRTTITYNVRNESGKTIRFRPTFYALPEEMESYIRRFECSCSKTYKLKKGESTTLTIEFELKGDFEDEYSASAEKIIIGLKTRAN